MITEIATHTNVKKNFHNDLKKKKKWGKYKTSHCGCVLSSSVEGCWFELLSVKAKTLQFEFATSPLSRRHCRAWAKTVGSE